jgi:hypothetical protein
MASLSFAKELTSRCSARGGNLASEKSLGAGCGEPMDANRMRGIIAEARVNSLAKVAIGNKVGRHRELGARESTLEGKVKEGYLIFAPIHARDPRVG